MAIPASSITVSAILPAALALQGGWRDEVAPVGQLGDQPAGWRHGQSGGPAPTAHFSHRGGQETRPAQPSEQPPVPPVILKARAAEGLAVPAPTGAMNAAAAANGPYQAYS